MTLSNISSHLISPTKNAPIEDVQGKNLYHEGEETFFRRLFDIPYAYNGETIEIETGDWDFIEIQGQERIYKDRPGSSDDLYSQCDGQYATADNPTDENLLPESILYRVQRAHNQKSIIFNFYKIYYSYNNPLNDYEEIEIPVRKIKNINSRILEIKESFSIEKWYNNLYKIIQHGNIDNTSNNSIALAMVECIGVNTGFYVIKEKNLVENDKEYCTVECINASELYVDSGNIHISYVIE